MLHLKCHEYSETCRIPRTIARFTYGSFTWTAKFRTALLKIEGQVVIKHEMKTNCLGRRGSRYAESNSGLEIRIFRGKKTEIRSEKFNCIKILSMVEIFISQVLVSKISTLYLPFPGWTLRIINTAYQLRDLASKS